MDMEALVNKLRASQSHEKSIKAIWKAAYEWSLPKDRSHDVNDPFQQIAILLYNKLSERCVVPFDFISSFVFLYKECVIENNPDSFRDLKEKIKEIDSFVSIEDRVDHYWTKKGSVYIARAKDNVEFFIAANGDLRKNFPHFDSWYKKSPDSIFDFYRKSIQKSLPRSGYLVYVDKMIGPRGPFKLMDEISRQFPGYGLIILSNGKIEIKKECQKENSTEYCILYDLILSGEGIKSYISRIKDKFPNLKFSRSIILYNEKVTRKELERSLYNDPTDSTIHDITGSDFLYKKCIPFLTFDEYKEVLLRYPMEYTIGKPEPNALEDMLFGLGTAVGFGDIDVANRFASAGQSLTRQYRNLRRYVSSEH
ncbi:hypothetical protein DESC_530015 [Desulfosarcina cetonica]|uniref:hypothetical protein n=1 Tax=Desulfosarcina cetonica TaxID=90730 RepID=UPI0006CF4D4C|nr:hypothetical protein [Desulfosarcina cetonica]VTR66901.1 hypothetical protein DESC_530015 [Desulfosarcina cetonica]